MTTKKNSSTTNNGGTPKVLPKTVAKEVNQSVNGNKPPLQLFNKPQPDSLSVIDLKVLTKIIDLASKRGAFAAAELKIVGEVYEKLDRIVKHLEPEPDKQTDKHTDKKAD